MRRHLFLFASVSVVLGAMPTCAQVIVSPASASVGSSTFASQSADGACAAAAAVAERTFGLPEGLLLAIGRVESGRSTSLGHQPWPWSINAEGVDTVTDSAQSAIAAVQGMQARGLRSIDTGCFQINLMFHPEAFSSLDEAFDPGANANYAARFLTELHQRSGDWGQAVAAYHSATPWRGENYRQLVWRAWSAPLLPDAPIAYASNGMALGALPGAPAGGRFIMRVFVPTGAKSKVVAFQIATSEVVSVKVKSQKMAAPSPVKPTTPLVVAMVVPRRGGLPVVFRPTLSR